MAASIREYQPKFGRVLIKRDINEKSAGGIIIPNAKRHAACEGVIIALGETAGITSIKDELINVLEVGQKVLFGRHAGTWIDESNKETDDGTLFLCQDEDILAVIKE